MAESALKSGAQTFSSAIETAHNYTRWVLSAFDGYYGSSILEVGLGHGGYREFLPAQARYVGVDIDAECVERSRERHPDDEFLVADITDPSLVAALNSQRVDTVLCINVLEHIPDDRAAINVMLDLLPVGGHLLLFSPAIPALYSAMDELAGHVRRYRCADVPVLAGTRAAVIRNDYFNAVGAVGWLINKAFRHADLDSASINAQIAAFDRFVVPFARIVDPPFRRLFGQSLVAVLRKS